MTKIELEEETQDTINKFREVLELFEALSNSADDASHYGLIIVDKETYNTMLDFVTNHCGCDDLPLVWNK